MDLLKTASSICRGAMQNVETVQLKFDSGWFVQRFAVASWQPLRLLARLKQSRFMIGRRWRTTRCLVLFRCSRLAVALRCGPSCRCAHDLKPLLLGDEHTVEQTAQQGGHRNSPEAPASLCQTLTRAQAGYAGPDVGVVVMKVFHQSVASRDVPNGRRRGIRRHNPESCDFVTCTANAESSRLYLTGSQC